MNVVCMADAKCEGGDDEAEEVVDERGDLGFEVVCTGCGTNARGAGLTDGCAFN